MNSLFFVVCIVAIVSVYGLVSEYMKARARKDERGAGVDEALAQIDVLEERVRVLERIVTEKKIDLRSEIDDL
ncbi:MAG: hypothetical protein IID59_04280 [Proteobacteria bacterium]|nr:hypothetical protein [Pseudomonadota bacterium]